MSTDGSSEVCVFGPVPSRRLGRSLGIDLVPPKTCSYDCVYCQIGPTTCHSMERRVWRPPEEILRQLAGKLSSAPDYITLSGAGEPTLYAALGELIDGIKRLSAVPVAVITNGSLLWMPEVRAGLARADLVVPSLDAGDERTFSAINRPVAGIDFERMVRGLLEFRAGYRGRYWLEIMLVAGLNDQPSALRAMADLARRIAPDKIQLNTVVRPPVMGSARPLTAARLARISGLFPPPVEVIAEAPPAAAAGGRTDAGEVLEMLRRHPCSAQDVCAGLGVSAEQGAALLQALVDDRRAVALRRSGRVYFAAAEGHGRPWPTTG